MPVEHGSNCQLDRRPQWNHRRFRIAHFQNVHARPFISKPQGAVFKLSLGGSFDSSINQV
jgi:hypothetical protein